MHSCSSSASGWFALLHTAVVLQWNSIIGINRNSECTPDVMLSRTAARTINQFCLVQCWNTPNVHSTINQDLPRARDGDEARDFGTQQWCPIPSEQLDQKAPHANRISRAQFGIALQTAAVGESRQKSTCIVLARAHVTRDDSLKEIPCPVAWAFLFHAVQCVVTVAWIMMWGYVCCIREWKRRH